MSLTYRMIRTRRDWHAQPLARLGGILVLALAISALGGWTRRARAADPAETVAPAQLVRVVSTLQSDLARAQGELAVAKVQLERHRTIDAYSARYDIPADLAGAIHDIAIGEGLDPAIAFRLVQVESGFDRTARSHRNALGYTQVRLATARFYDPQITEAKLVDRDVNLRMGFRYLRDLLNQFDGDMRLALLAYNRGPQRVTDILAAGEDPANGYAEAVLRGARRSVRN